MMFRQYELSKFNGTKVNFKTMAQRRELIGKRVGYDLRGSCMSHYGEVTGTERGEIYIDGNPVNVGSIEQLCVLDQKP